MNRDPEMLRAAAAANIAAWHEANVTALGASTAVRDGLWLAMSPVPVIFFNAIGVRAGAVSATVGATQPSERWSAVYDPWCDLDLTPFEYHREDDQAWMVREPGPAIDDQQRALGLTVERVNEVHGLADFERASAIGFGVEPTGEQFYWHAPPLLDDPRLVILRGCLEGRTVAGAMAFVDAGVVGVYSVSTVPDARGRGSATALTRAAFQVAPELPAVLQPSHMAESLYARLGFQRFATFHSWARRSDRARAAEAAAAEVAASEVVAPEVATS